MTTPANDARLRHDYERWRGALRGELSVRDRAHLARQFARETRRTGVARGARVFEVGFGAGHFLDWAAAAGYRAEGCEIDERYVEHARGRGHTVTLGSGAEALDASEGQFDLVVALDVLEHLDASAVGDLLAACARRLCPGGRLLARFPNGASPFSRPMQHGDATHRSVLTTDCVAQIGESAGLRPVWAGNAARDRTLNGPSSLLKVLAFAVRDLVELGCGLVYFGKRVALDPNVTLVLERPGEQVGP